MFWAKKSGPIWHDLTAHLMDVGSTCDLLLAERLSSAHRDLLLLGDRKLQHNTITALVALHDLGKLSPGFQNLDHDMRLRLEGEGFTFNGLQGNSKYRHDHGSSAALVAFFDEYELRNRTSVMLARLIGGHHGQLPSSRVIAALEGAPSLGMDRKWVGERDQLIEDICGAFGLPNPSELAKLNLQPSARLLFLGLTTLADWIGSQETPFTFVRESVAAIQYRETSLQRAHTALKDGWPVPVWPAEPLPPAVLIETDSTGTQPRLRPVQQLAESNAQKLTSPFLAVIEAATGGGKTEASWLLVDYAARELGQMGCYIAMPTMATSNQMHDRYRTFLKNRLGKKNEPLLVHGQAYLKQLQVQQKPQDVGRDARDEQDGGQRHTEEDAYRWFRTSKRALLSRFGVGTVDQALMGVLPVRHGYLRLFGLAGKVAIFDEVHAYDHYMFALFERLLTWLRAVGASVIVLSATLPRQQRQRLLAAWDEDAAAEAAIIANDAALSLPDNWDEDERGRSRLTIRTSDGSITSDLGEAGDEGRSVRVDWVAEDEGLIDRIAAAVRKGCRVAWICNTVGDAQERFTRLHDRYPELSGDLFHARFTISDRNTVEKRVLADFGKHRTDQQGRYLIATQVVEQSLDLDFDWLISDLAPVDLLIQRAGRLWRHKRDTRPAEAPVLTLICPEHDDNELPVFGLSEYVYDRYTLLRTWYELHDRTAIDLPAMTRSLIEAVYGDDDPDLTNELSRSDLVAAREKADTQYEIEEDLADTALIPYPKDWYESKTPLGLYDEDDPGLHNTLKAATRLGPPSVQVILVQAVDDDHVRPLHSADSISRNKRLSDQKAISLIESSVSIAQSKSRMALWNALLDNPAYRLPDDWRKHGLLKHQRVVELDEDGESIIGGVKILYTKYLGFLAVGH